jgi:pectinesterase
MKSGIQKIALALGLCAISCNALGQSTLQTQLASYIKYVVAKDGSGNYTTVQAAINAVPNNSTTSQVIFVKKGTYNEKVEIPSTKTHITLIGEDVSTTIIANGDYSGSGKLYNGIITSSNGTAIGTSTSHTLFAAADDFTMMNITVTNTAGDVGQAVALNANADRQFYYHCKITGHQDTYLTWAAKRYYHKDCYIEGAVDFIFGGGVALFDSCQLNAVRSGISYTAASTGQNFKFGYVFNNCKLTANSGVTGIFLGRPWYPYCQVVFLNSEEPAALDPAGWSKWGGNNNDQTCYYAEYKNCGAGSSTTNRATWTHQLTAAQAATYNVANIFDKSVNPSPYAANWLPVPENDPIYRIIKKNTTRFITSACFSSTTGPTALAKQGAGSSNQTIALGTAIVPYSFAWTNASTVTVTGMPAGITVDINNSTQIVSISGTPTKAGVFNFTVTTVGGHPDSTKKGSITVTSVVTDLSSEEVRNESHVYPNPFNALLTLTMKGDFDYQIYGLDGILHESGKGTDKAEVGSLLPPSMYVLKMQGAYKTTVLKISKTN